MRFRPNFWEAIEVGAPRRLLAGEGMVTPVKPISLGGYDRLIPGISRVAIDHQLVRDRPEHFEPADKRDRSTITALRSLLEAADSDVTRELARRRGEPEPSASSRATSLYGSRSRRRPYWELSRRHHNPWRAAVG